jgi:hypothetical protein
MKIKLLTFVFVLNLLVTIAYIILKYLGYVFISRYDFTLLLIYDIITLVIFGELLQDEDKKRNIKE